VWPPNSVCHSFGCLDLPSVNTELAAHHGRATWFFMPRILASLSSSRLSFVMLLTTVVPSPVSSVHASFTFSRKASHFSGPSLNRSLFKECHQRNWGLIDCPFRTYKRCRSLRFYQLLGPLSLNAPFRDFFEPCVTFIEVFEL